MQNTDDILNEVERRFYDIPFENSDYQNETFLILAQQTPARAYRTIGLRMSTKIQAIKELKYGRQLDQIEIEEYQATIDDLDSTPFEKRKAQVEINKKKSGHNYTNKLLNDAIHDLNYMYTWLQKFPEYTREQFELEERDHFLSKLTLSKQCAGDGNSESLAFMDPKNKKKFNINLEDANTMVGSDKVSVPFITHKPSGKEIINELSLHPLVVKMLTKDKSKITHMIKDTETIID